MKKPYLLCFISLYLIQAGVLNITVKGQGVYSKLYNYDENKVPSYSLPQALLSKDGIRITTVDEWERIRRPEILSLFASEIYGHTPTEKIKMSYKILERNENVFEGKAIRKQILLMFTAGGIQHDVQLLMYLPKQSGGKVPVFLSLNFFGNQTVSADPGIILSKSWNRNNERLGVIHNNSSEAKRGGDASRWSIQRAISNGFGVATACYCDFFPDSIAKVTSSILSLFGAEESDDGSESSCQAIGAWAWGMSRIMDYLEEDVQVNAKKVVLVGLSRIGKAALWAGAQDKRFAMVISACSGSLGAALSRRAFGETIDITSGVNPHWFCKKITRYYNNESALPVDQHELIALMAPRPVYVSSAEEDLKADPRGEFLSAVYAGEAYQLYGLKGLDTDVMPPVDTPIMNDIGYHMRTGVHDITDYDWECYIEFAKKKL